MLAFEEVFDDLYSLRDSGNEEIDEYEDKMKDFSRILYSDKPPTPKEIAEGLKAAIEFVRSSGRV